MSKLGGKGLYPLKPSFLFVLNKGPGRETNRKQKILVLMTSLVRAKGLPSSLSSSVPVFIKESPIVLLTPLSPSFDTTSRH